jgi:hypothetical protein
MAISCFARRGLPAASAVLARKDGANPRLTRANPLLFRKMRRDVITVLLPPQRF